MAEPGAGHVRLITDLGAEVTRLARERQVRAGQVCAPGNRRDGCPMHHVPPRERAHDPDHCDRVWEGS
jgi:hypothetical protein